MNPDLLERALESLASGLTVYDATRPDFPIVFANTAFERLTGYSRDEVVGRSYDLLHGPDTDPAAIAEIHEAMGRGRTCFVTLIHYRADGSPFWNEIALSPLYNGDDQLVQYVALQRDVSARESGAEALRDAEGRYRRLLENLNGVVTWIADFDDRGGTIEYISPQIETLLGYPRDDWVGRRPVWYDALHPDDAERAYAAQRARVGTDTGETIEYRFIADDGRVVWVWDKCTLAERRGDHIRREGMFLDVTAVKEAEAALMLAEERQRSVVDVLEDGVLVIDAEGMVLLANRGYSRLVGFEPEIGKHALQVWDHVQGFWEDGRPIGAGNSIGMSVLESGKPVVGETIRIVRPDGQERWVSANYLPLNRPGGGAELVMSLHDITERRRVSEALRESEERMRGVDRERADRPLGDRQGGPPDDARGTRARGASGSRPRARSASRSSSAGRPQLDGRRRAPARARRRGVLDDRRVRRYLARGALQPGARRAAARSSARSGSRST